MTKSDLLELLFPCLTFFLKGASAEDVYRYLSVADQINQQNIKKPLDRAILTACLLYPILKKEIEVKYLQNNIIPHFGDILLDTASLAKGLLTSSFSHFPKRISMLMCFILSTQYRMTPLSGKRHHRPKIILHNEFEFALRFLKIRSLVDEHLVPDFDWWLNCTRQAERQHEHRGHRPHPAPDHDHEETAEISE